MTKGQKANERLQYSFFMSLCKNNVYGLITHDVHFQGIYFFPVALFVLELAENHFKSFLLCSANQTNLQPYFSPEPDLLCTILFWITEQSVTRPFFCVCWGRLSEMASPVSYRAVCSEMLGQKPRGADIRGRVSDSHHTAEDTKKASAARGEGRAKTELIQTASDGHCQERFLWEVISHTSEHACVCDRVDKMKENRWEGAKFEGFEGESRCESPSVSAPSHSVATAAALAEAAGDLWRKSEEAAKERKGTTKAEEKTNSRDILIGFLSICAGKRIVLLLLKRKTNWMDVKKCWPAKVTNIIKINSNTTFINLIIIIKNFIGLECCFWLVINMWFWAVEAAVQQADKCLIKCSGASSAATKRTGCWSSCCFLYTLVFCKYFQLHLRLWKTLPWERHAEKWWTNRKKRAIKENKCEHDESDLQQNVSKSEAIKP